MYIEITSDPSLGCGIRIGDIFKAKLYWLDPSNKFTLIKKVKGSKKPYEKESRNHYRINAKIVTAFLDINHNE